MQGLKFRGRPPIRLAESVKEVVHLDNPYAAMIMSRSAAIDEDFVGAILAQSLFGWEGRNPAPALDPDGNFQCTDLDLLSFLVPMAERDAVIEIPRYRNRRRVVIKANERKIGTNQFGPLTGIISNQDVLSFSVRIFDNTVVARDPETGKESTGAHRNYMIVDCDGHWYDGWDKIIWSPTAEENRFLNEHRLWSGNTVYFKHYVHPARWQSMFGAPYLLLKMLLARIDEEAKFYRAEMKRLEDKGLVLPRGEKKPYVPPLEEGETEPIKVETIEVVLDLPEFKGSYKPVPDTMVGLVHAYQRQKYLTYTFKPQVQFVVRADEAAYFKYGHGGVAPWMGSRQWNSGWRAPKGRIDWEQMVLAKDVALRYRTKTVTQQVSAE